MATTTTNPGVIGAQLGLFDFAPVAPPTEPPLMGRCRAGHMHRYTATVWETLPGRMSATMALCSHGIPVTVRAVRVRVTSTRCDPRCTGATGPRCDCSCGGHNHGAGWSV